MCDIQGTIMVNRISNAFMKRSTIVVIRLSG